MAKRQRFRSRKNICQGLVVVRISSDQNGRMPVITIAVHAIPNVAGSGIARTQPAGEHPDQPGSARAANRKADQKTARMIEKT